MRYGDLRGRVLRGFVLGLALLTANQALAAGGTAIVAHPGSEAFVSKSWPAGVDAMVNDPARTTGWNSWFSEWPNDVNQYAFDIKSADDLNRLLQALSKIDSPLRQVRLSHLKEPQHLGWVTSLPAGNGIAAIFSIGDQNRIDQWYQQLRQPFGVMEFVAAPEAVPPTLTIFVQHDVVDLEQLQIPPGVSVSAGYVPTLFHRSNTVQERDRKQAAAAPRGKIEQPDAATQQALDQIVAILKRLSARDAKRAAD